jgi:uncharacterized protein (DUF58 family)
VRLHRRGLLLLTTSLAALGLGAVTTVPVVTGFGAALLGGVTIGWALAVHASFRMQAGAVTLDHGTGDSAAKIHTAGRELALPVVLRNTSGVPLRWLEARLVATSGLRGGLDASALPADAPGRGDARVVFALTPDSAGLHVIHGAHLLLATPASLFTIEAYAPARRELRVLPRSAASPGRLPFAATEMTLRNAEGKLTTSLRGFGLELKELREHVPGDPFKHIEWKATARRRKLVVREFEADVTLSAFLVLDASPSMRWGAPGSRALDRAIETAYPLAVGFARQRDRFAAVVCDGDIVSQSRPATGHSALLQVTEQIMDALHPVDPRVTELTDDELLVRVAEYARLHGGPDTTRDARGRPASQAGEPSPAGIDVPTLLDWVEAELAQDHERHRRLWQLRLPEEDRSLTDRLRTFCRARGIELPTRPDALIGAKESGISAALELIHRTPGGPHTVIVLSDLAGVHDAERVSRSVRLLRTRRHQVVFAIPDSGASPADSALQAAVAQVLSLDEAVQRTDLTLRLLTAGARIWMLGGRSMPQTVRRAIA